jgi:hypothetical protein
VRQAVFRATPLWIAPEKSGAARWLSPHSKKIPARQRMQPASGVKFFSRQTQGARFAQPWATRPESRWDSFAEYSPLFFHSCDIFPNYRFLTPLRQK